MEDKLNNYKIVHELSDEHIRQLVAYTMEDADIRWFTRDAQRFADFESAKRFIGQVKIYALLFDDELAGIIWFTNKLLPNKSYIEEFAHNLYDTTFAIRLYEPAKGKKLALPFMQEAFSQFEEQKNQNYGIWLESRADNSRAIHLYQKFGFRKISEPDSDNRILMVK